MISMCAPFVLGSLQGFGCFRSEAIVADVTFYVKITLAAAPVCHLSSGNWFIQGFMCQIRHRIKWLQSFTQKPFSWTCICTPISSRISPNFIVQIFSLFSHQIFTTCILLDLKTLCWILSILNLRSIHSSSTIPLTCWHTSCFVGYLLQFLPSNWKITKVWII